MAVHSRPSHITVFLASADSLIFQKLLSPRMETIESIRSKAASLAWCTWSMALEIVIWYFVF